ncbi:3-phosphoglycerate dehydrogenase [Bosea thiooxidans]|uniref:(S)-sulfolactate dehydrogenase n=1 Tax=Bosea thiooxidans TaxID=53254 RepID=A0A0Q3I3Q8_9HYPH|nr:hydroxyacid dehydrogenase [Bosea thiooxidans]KQK29349.1 3-phosphoglycerate dehydrogenase [Bosea thiooxidans]SKC03935.1 (S)-sulfolactate dehydrogenase [Bosea thiooxidans]
MTDIVITEFIDEAAIAGLRARYTVHYDPELYAHPDEMARLFADVPAVIVRNQTQVRGKVLEAAKALKVIGRLGVGLDNLDMETCAARGIRVFPATGANSLSVVEYVIGTTMTLLRGAYFANAAMLAGEFPKTRLIGREVAGKLMGLVGFGAIARDVARHARAIGMEVAAYHPRLPADDPAWSGVRRLELEELLAQADVVSLHVPLTSETRGMIDARAFARMKPDAILINTARGGIADDAALVAALKAGKLGGAAIDVYEQEPLGKDAAKVFTGAPNLILTPHIAGNTVESNARVSGLVAEKVMAALEERI